MRRPTFRLSCSHETWIKVFPCDPPLSRHLNSSCLNITRGPAHSLACPSCCNDGPDPAVYMLVGAPQVRHKLTLRMIKVSAMSIWVSWFHGSPLWTVKPVLSSTEWITTATFGISRFCALPLGETHQGSCPIPVALGDITDPQLHDWLEAGKRGWRGGSEAEQKNKKQKIPASHATLVPVTLDHMPPCATKPCHSSLPLGKQRPLSGQSPMWSCGAEAICSSWLLARSRCSSAGFARRPGRFRCLGFGLGRVHHRKVKKVDLSEQVCYRLRFMVGGL